MKNETAIKLIMLFSLFGVLFAGWLTAGTLFVGACPLSGECPLLFGYPACDYGLIIFAVILISSIMMYRKYTVKLMKIAMYVSLFGVLFATYFTSIEIMNPRPSYTLLLPSCIYGLIMYIVIFILTILVLRKK